MLYGRTLLFILHSCVSAIASWVDLDMITLSELSQRKTNTIGLKYKEFQKKTKDGTQSRKMFAKDWRVGQIGRDF